MGRLSLLDRDHDPMNLMERIAELLRRVEDLERPLGWSALKACRAYNSSNISISSGSWTDLTFDSERFDTGNMHSVVSNTGRLTAPEHGVYHLSGNVRFDQHNTGARGILIKLNGTTDIAIEWPIPPNTTWDLSLQLSTVYELEADDYVELYAFQNSGGSLDVESSSNTSPEFSMVLLS